MAKNWFRSEGENKEEEAVVEEKAAELEEKNEETPEPEPESEHVVDTSAGIQQIVAEVKKTSTAVNPMMGTPAKVKRPSSGL